MKAAEGIDFVVLCDKAQGRVMEKEDDLPVSAHGDASPFNPVKEGMATLPNLNGQPNLRGFGVKEFRFRGSYIIKDIKRNDWLIFTNYGETSGAIVSKDDLDFLIKLGGVTDVKSLVGAFEGWGRCRSDAPIISALRGMMAEAGRSAPTLAEFSDCVPSNGPDGNVRAVEFGGGDYVKTGQLAIAGSVETGLYLHGFIDRADPDVHLVLDLPNGQRIDDAFFEDGSALHLRRTEIDSPIALLDVRIRPIGKGKEPLLLG